MIGTDEAEVLIAELDGAFAGCGAFLNFKM